MLQKYEQSTFVVEAEVVSKETVKCDDGLIYQRVKIELFQILKGGITGTSDSQATVILRGGTLNGEQQQWNHNVDLPIGQRFIGFLTSYNTSCFEDLTYRFFGGVQGKYYYDYDPMGLRIMCPGHSFGDPNKFYDRLSEVSNSTFEPQLDIDPSTKTMTCLELMFEVSIPNPLEPLNLDVLVSIRTSNESKLISKPVFSFNYDEDALGGNAGTNGVVSLENLGISSHYNYESIIEDIAPDEIRISVDAIDLSEPDLILISNVYQPLMKVRLSLPSLLDPGVVLQEQTIIELSRYFDVEDNLEKYFDCVRVYGDIQSVFGGCTPEILSLNSLTQLGKPNAAGVDLILHINGTCLGDGESATRFLEFTDAKYGSGVNGEFPVWVKAFDSDILSWNQNNISVLVPSQCKPPNGESLYNDTLNRYAGQGKIRINTGENDLPSDIVKSNQELQINFAWRNRYTNYPSPTPTPPNDDAMYNHSLPVYLVDYMATEVGPSGYFMYYDENFPNDYKPAFERALNTWRCSDVGSGVNVHIVSPDTIEDVLVDLASRIYMGDLPNPLLSDGLLAKAISQTSICFNNNNEYNLFARMKKSDIVFNNSVAWHYSDDTNADLSALNYADLETVALHELGHWHGLLHVNHEYDIMYWVLLDDYRREMTGYTMLGGQYIMEQSTNEDIATPLSECTNFSPASFYSDCAYVNDVDENIISYQGINIYPNPSDNHISIELDRKMGEIYEKLYVFNALGEIVKQVTITDRTIIINVSEFSQGIYFIVSSNNRYKKPFIIQR